MLKSLINCPLCNSFSTVKINKFDQHLITVHNTTSKDLYDLIHPNDHLCNCGCNQEVKWINYRLGYSKFLRGHNGSIYSIYDEATALKISQKRSNSLLGKTGWSKGLSKETDDKIAKRALATSIGRKNAFVKGEINIWNKGLTKEIDNRIAKSAENLQIGYATGIYTPWAKGKSKYTDQRVADMACNVSITHNKKEIREHLDSFKRLSKDEIQKRVIESKYELLDGLKNYNNKVDKILLVKCLVCGTEKYESLLNIEHGRCLKCHPGGSRAQEEIAQYVESLGVEINRNDRSILDNRLELDIYVPSRKFAIEYNGLYWHNENYKPAMYHEYKSAICRDKNINLFHVYEDEWRDKKEIIKSMIRHKLGLTEKKYFASRLEIRQLKSNDPLIIKFLNNNHLENSTWCHTTFCLFDNDIPIAMMCIRKSNNKKLQCVVGDIIRYATLINTHVHGGFSRLLKHCSNWCVDNNISLMTLKYNNRFGINNITLKNNFSFHHSIPVTFQWTDNDYRYNKNSSLIKNKHLYKIWGCKTDVYIHEIKHAA